MGSVAGPAIGAVGSIAGGLLGSRGSSSGGIRVPRWYSDSAQSLAQFGRNLALQPYVAPPADRVAPFSPDTLAAFDLVRQNVGSTLPAYQNAMQTAERLQGYQAPNVGTSFTPQSVQTQFDPRTVDATTWASLAANGGLDQYMNPYTQNVIDTSLADLENQRAVQYNNLASQAQAAGAFGGSRFGVAQGQFEADALRDKATLAAQLRNQGFESASQRMLADAGMLNQAAFANQAAGITADQMGFQGQLANQGADLTAQQMGLQGQMANQNASLASVDVQNRNAFLQGVLGDRIGAANAADATALGGIGATQQAFGQQQLDNQYADWFDQYRAYPQFQTGLWSGALGPGSVTIGGAPYQTGGGLLGALGGAQLGAQVGNSIYNWYQGLGGGGGGMTSLSGWNPMTSLSGWNPAVSPYPIVTPMPRMI